MRRSPRHRPRRRVMPTVTPLSSRTGPPQTGLRLRGGEKSTVPAQKSGCAGGTQRAECGWLRYRARRRGATFFESQAKPLDPVLSECPTDFHALFSANLIAQLGNGDVGLGLDQSQHMSADLVPYPIAKSEARLDQTPSVTLAQQLLAHLAHILPADAKTARKHAATTFAAFIGLQYLYPQIIRVGSSHRIVAVASPENSSVIHPHYRWVYLS